MRPLIAFFLVCVLSQVGLAQQPVRSILQKCFGPNCNQQSQAWPDVRTSAITDWSGYIVTGGRDVDGAKIIAVGPVPDPVPTLAPALPPVASNQAIGAPAEMSRMDFRQAVLKAARQERGVSLGFAEYWAVFRGSLKPQLVEEARQCVFDSGIQDGVIPVSQTIDAIDWAKLIELIIKYLPQIIDIFTGK